MSQAFDISQDELPIFVAEADEHLQTLDEILIQLESLKNDEKALQAAFRAAHTLKGMAGMVGHTRMVKLTHALETVLDGFRKGGLEITTELIDLCLDAVDNLRLLRVEVVTGDESDLNCDDLADRLENAAVKKGSTEQQVSPVHIEAAAQGIPAIPERKNGAAADCGQVKIDARINPKSVASAARAFQLMMALQDLGTIQEMNPSQDQIETARPVDRFHAVLITCHPVEKVRQVLSSISEVDELTVQPAGEGQNEPAAMEQVSAAARPAGSPAEMAKPDGRPGEDEAGEQRKSDGGQAAGKADRMVRTSVERLDALMDLVGELITDRNQLTQIRSRLKHGHSGENEYEQLAETAGHLSRITDQLQEQVMRIRMQPVANVFHKFPRLVRDLAQKTGKKIDFMVQGEDTELDRSVIEEINDPLIHLLRNAVDHGIEPVDERIAAGKSERGKILLSARHEQGRIVLTVEDDGRGIDVARLKKSAIAKGLITEEEAKNYQDEKGLELIFLSGLSTSSRVTDISGRGVGLDIVRNNVQKIRGNILVDTKPGQGTSFQIILPLTLAIIPTLLVRVSSIPFAIPIIMVAETLRLTSKDIKTVRGKPVTLLRDKVLPLVYIRDVFKLEGKDFNSNYLYVVVVSHGKQQVGLVVDSLMGEEEVVVKSLGDLLKNIEGISSATILGDGSVALIIDVSGLLKAFEVRGEVRKND